MIEGKVHSRVLSLIVTYNGAEWIDDCLTSLIESELPTDIVVIDNDSQDRTVTIIQKSYPQVKLITTGDNLGFGKANNIGLRYALENDYDYVFLLNQDAWLKDKDSLQLLVDNMDKHPGLAVVSPLQLNKEEGLEMQFASYVNKYAPELEVAIAEGRNPKTQLVRFTNAAAWLMTKDCIQKCGIFSPMFEHYGEDSNYADRMAYLGLELGVFTGAAVIHDRPQLKVVNLGKHKYENRLKMMCIEHLSNVNHSFVRQILYTTMVMIFKSLKNLAQFKFDRVVSPIKALFFGFRLQAKVVTYRSLSKSDGAFIDDDSSL